LTSRREVSLELSRVLHLYADRFNKRDWEGLRKLISADARLRFADRFAGPIDESHTSELTNGREVPWRLTVGRCGRRVDSRGASPHKTSGGLI